MFAIGWGLHSVNKRIPVQSLHQSVLLTSSHDNICRTGRWIVRILNVHVYIYICWVDSYFTPQHMTPGNRLNFIKSTYIPQKKFFFNHSLFSLFAYIFSETDCECKWFEAWDGSKSDKKPYKDSKKGIGSLRSSHFLFVLVLRLNFWLTLSQDRVRNRVSKERPVVYLGSNFCKEYN